jgi:hypothetical protein
MGKLVAVGGLHVPSKVRPLERDLDKLCAETGFPPGEEFKWSPERKQWMRHLVGTERTDFFLEALSLARRSGASAIVTVVEAGAQPANQGVKTAHEDAVTLFLERAHNQVSSGGEAIVILDQPGGRRKDETTVLRTLIRRMNTGTTYTSLDHLALVVATDSSLVRLVQLADVTVGCTLAYVAGERKWSAAVFEGGIKPILRSAGGRIGGVGLKIHPDGRYANLYHWLLGDTTFVKNRSSRPLPLSDHPYAASPDVP